MKQTIAILICALIFGCKSEVKPNKTNLSDINLVIKTNTKIDSVEISDFAQTEGYYLPFSDTIKVNFKNEINDLFIVSLFTNGGVKSNQFWLKGKNVIITGKQNGKFEIDSVINSDLYYNSTNIIKNYIELVQNKSDSSAIDNFLLENISENIQSPFSFKLAKAYIFRNQNDKAKIRRLFDTLSPQSDTLKNHVLSIHENLNNLLNLNYLNIGDYKFVNNENQVTSIEQDKTRKYLIDFWFVKCPPCVSDHKLISEKLDFLKEKNIELIGISIDRNHSVWKNYLKKHNYNWKNYREITSLKKLSKDMAISTYPTYFLLNNKGEIKARYNSFEHFEKAFE